MSSILNIFFFMAIEENKLNLLSTIRIAYGAIIIALAIALGYALALVPNVELVTLTLAIGGYLLGGGWGLIVGALGFGLYSILSPFGVAPPLLLLAQILGGGLIGYSGSLLRKKVKKKWTLVLKSALIGGTVTLFYDLLTNLGSYIMITSEKTLIPFIVGGLSFSILHIVANVVIFAVLFPILSRYLKPVSGKNAD